jgi:hypothetical protein
MYECHLALFFVTYLLVYTTVSVHAYQLVTADLAHVYIFDY